MLAKSNYKNIEQEKERCLIKILCFLIFLKKKLLVKQENKKLNLVRNTLENLFKDLKNKVQKEYDDHKQLIDSEKVKREELINSMQGQFSELQKNFETTSLEKYQKQKENELYLPIILITSSFYNKQTD